MTMKLKLVATLIVLAYSASLSYSQNLIILARHGNVLFYDDESRMIVRKIESHHLSRDWAWEAYFDGSVSTPTLYINTTSRKIYRMRFDSENPTWVMLTNPDRNEWGLIYDDKNKLILTTSSVIERDSTAEAPRTFVAHAIQESSPTAKADFEADPHNFRFVYSSELRKDMLPNGVGVMNHEEVYNKSTTKDFISPNQWVLAGASENFLTYMQRPSHNSTRNSIFIEDIVNAKSIVKNMSQKGKPYTFKDAVVIQDMDYEGAREHQGRTKVIWIYNSDIKDLVKLELEDGARILFADNASVFYASDNEIKKLEYNEQGVENKKSICGLDDVPVAVFPRSHSGGTN
jgi:hypothetical protein